MMNDHDYDYKDDDDHDDSDFDHHYDPHHGLITFADEDNRQTTVGKRKRREFAKKTDKD